MKLSIKESINPKNRSEWRDWLSKNYDKKNEIWLIFERNQNGQINIEYLDAVEEALCVGWIDGIQIKINDSQYAQRFTPRTPKSHWTELNKESARRLIKLGKMKNSGFKVLPNLDVSTFTIPDNLREILKKDSEVWKNFQKFPPFIKG